MRRYVGRHRKPDAPRTPYTKGGYRGGRPAAEMGPPAQLPSATIRPGKRVTILAPPNAPRLVLRVYVPEEDQ